jgi:dihydroorotase-like cyclic amidohydrolase
MGKRLAIIIGTAACLGGGRLAFNEVELANHRVRFSTLEARASEAETDRKLVVGLEGELRSAQDQVASITHEAREGLAEQRRVTEKLAEDLSAAGAALKAQATEARDREQALRTAADERVRALEGERDQARAQAAGEARRREASEAALAESAERLRESEAVATARAARLAKLRAAGVNVARLSGERPMPRISAVVVRIDAGASPLGVLIDAGSSAGLELGDRLYVFRDGREIACLEVLEIGEQIASTRLVRAVRGLGLKAGDDVRSQPADPQ